MTPTSSTPVESLLETVYGLVATNDRIQAFRRLCASTEGAFARHDLAFVNEVLDRFDPARGGRFLATGLLRSTFRARAVLPGWKSCLQRVAADLRGRGEDVARILQGLGVPRE